MHRNARRIFDPAALDGRPQAEELVERYGNEWIATARRNCSGAADAEDAYQRALEKLLTRPPAESDPERIAAWMHTVVRNEALQIVRSRKRESGAEFDAIAERLVADVAIPDEQAIDGEDHEIAKEALRRLRPDQTRCLLLRADGFDYPEICRVTGFSYAKVNRLLSEGRKAARMRVDSIDAGRECERIESLISMFVDGMARADAEDDVRMHLEHCARCRATARDYALAPRDLAAIFPVGAAVAGHSIHVRLLEPFQRALEFLQARLGGGNPDSTIALVKKAAAVVAVGATAAAGGAAIKKHSDPGDEVRPSTNATGPAALLSPISLTARERAQRAAARRRAHAHAEERRSRDAEESAGSIASDPATPDAEAAADRPATDGAIASDPAETTTDNSHVADQTGTLGP
ncbi:MAG: sigma-70 family RNA polymerase sigma factor [Solirubrobacterales bacterium]